MRYYVVNNLINTVKLMNLQHCHLKVQYLNNGWTNFLSDTEKYAFTWYDYVFRNGSTYPFERDICFGYCPVHSKRFGYFEARSISVYCIMVLKNMYHFVALFSVFYCFMFYIRRFIFVLYLTTSFLSLFCSIFDNWYVNINCIIY